MRWQHALLIVLLAAAPARADDADRSAAEKLFEEGRALLAKDQFDAACAKFDESLRKDPAGIGALLNLALCNERRGKIATALALYQRALDQATEARVQGQQKAAQDKVVALSPKVPIVTIALAAPAAEGTKLVIDDGVVPVATKELPIDPGRHEVVASAPGRLPFQTTFEIAAGERKPLVVPVLQLPESATTVVRTNRRRSIGQVAALGGAGLLVGASGLALYARHSYNAAFAGAMPECGGDRPDIDGRPACSQAGIDQTSRARSLGTAATVIGGFGLAVGVAGAVLWWTTPRRESVRVVPTASPGAVGVALRGAF